MPDPLLQPPPVAPAPVPVPVIQPAPTAVTYNPATAKAATTSSVGFTAKPYEVANEAKVASQLQDIIDKGSPLMQQARQYALEQMGARGLTNSSLAVGAGQSAVIQSALPIATADAATFAKAGEMTTTAENAALQFGAAGKNAAFIQDANLTTATEQFNAGQKNAAESLKAQQQNQMLQQKQQIEGQAVLQTQQIQGAKDLAAINNAAAASIEAMKADTSLTITDKQTASALVIKNIEANTQLSLQDKVTAIQKYIADLQNSTTIGVEQAKNLTQMSIESMKTNAALTIEQQKTASAQLIAGQTNQTTLAQQTMMNDAALANIQAKGVVDIKLTTISEQYKQLLQSNQNAAQAYTQALQSIGQILNNPEFNADSKSAAINAVLAVLNDGLATFSGISSTPNVQTNLDFSGDFATPYTPPTVTPSVTTSPGVNTGTAPIVQPAATPSMTPQAAATALTAAYKQILGVQPDAEGLAFWQQKIAQGASLADVKKGIAATPEGQITSLYVDVLGKPPDQAGLAYWKQQLAAGATIAQIKASFAAMPEATQPVTQQSIAGLYQMLLGHPPDTAGLQFWLDSGVTGAQLAAAIKGSAEYQQLYGA